MTYEKFKDNLLFAIDVQLRKASNTLAIEQVSTEDENGVAKEGLVVVKTDGRNMNPCKPSIYFRDAYNKNIKTSDIVQIANYFVQGSVDYYDEIDVYLDNINYVGEQLRDNGIESVQDYLVATVIPQRGNEEFLKRAYHKEFLDLAVVYRLLFIRETAGVTQTTSIPITRDVVKLDKAGQERLHLLAMQNSYRVLRPRLLDVSTMLLMSGEESLLPQDVMRHVSGLMFAVTNEHKVFGAYVITDNEYLDSICKINRWESMLIIPSSIHDIIVLEDTGRCDYKTIRGAIVSANNGFADMEEVLSNTLYRYSTKTGVVSMVLYT